MLCDVFRRKRRSTRQLLALAAAAASLALIFLAHSSRWSSDRVLPPVEVALPLHLSSTKTLSRESAARLDSQALHVASQLERSPLQCTIDPVDEVRYAHLWQNETAGVFIAILLYNNEEILPNMMDEIVALSRIFGSERVFVSIYENGSTDKTPSYLLLLARRLAWFGVPHKIESYGSTSPKTIEARVAVLARLRNKVLEPLLSLAAGPFAQVVFMNDVAFCASDVLELLHQHTSQGACLTCGLDISAFGALRAPINWQGFAWRFRDIWVMRLLNGEYFSHHNTLRPWREEGSDHAKSRARYVQGLPFQVFSCWNGMVVIDARALLPSHNFRSVKGTNIASEAYLFALDLWKRGHPRIQTVPGVRLAYSMSEYARFNHGRKPYRPGRNRDDRISWRAEPPVNVEWYPYNRNFWEPQLAEWHAWDYEPAIEGEQTD